MMTGSFDALTRQARQRVARQVAGASDAQLGRLESGLARRVVLAGLPVALRLRFNRADARELTGALELRIRQAGGVGYDPITIMVRDGRCAVRRGASARPTATMTSSLADLLRSGTGAADLLVLIAQGRVVLTGDAWFAFRFPALFRLPTRPLV